MRAATNCEVAWLVVVIPGRPIKNRPQVKNLPYIAAKAHCATGMDIKQLAQNHKGASLVPLERPVENRPQAESLPYNSSRADR
jgi:hypothetical protein